MATSAAVFDLAAYQARIQQKLQSRGVAQEFIASLLELPESTTAPKPKKKKHRSMPTTIVPCFTNDIISCGDQFEYKCNFTGKSEHCDAMVCYDVFWKNDHDALHLTIQIEMSEIRYEASGGVRDMYGGYNTTITKIHKNTIMRGLEHLVGKCITSNLEELTELNQALEEIDHRLTTQHLEILRNLVDALQQESLWGDNVDHRVIVFVGNRVNA